MESELIQVIDSIANSIDALAQPRFIDWLAVILSGAAILFAVRVANKQNKIALFEKRMHSYNVLTRLKDYADMVCMEKYQNVFLWQQIYWGIHDIFKNRNYQKAIYDVFERSLLTTSCLEEDLDVLHSLQFLIPDLNENEVNDTTEKLRKLIDLLFNLPKDAPPDNSIFPELQAKKDDFVSSFNPLYSKSMTKLKCLLRLK